MESRSLKKILFAGVALGLALGLAMSDLSAGDLKAKFTWGSGSATGTFNIIIGNVTEKLKVKYPGLDITIVPGGSVTNTIRLGTGDFPIAMITSLPAKLGYLGTGRGKLEGKGPYKQIRGIASIYNQHFQFVCPKDFPAETIDDVIEKKMKVRIVPGGPRGHIGPMAMEDILKGCYGLTFKDMEKWGAKVIFAEFSEATTGIQDGHIDLFTPLTAAPNGGITSLATQRPVKFLGMKKGTLDKMEKLGYPTGTLPAGTYPGQDYDVVVSIEGAGFYARADFDEEIVYVITKFVLENEQYMKTIHRRTKEDFNPKTAWKGFGVPLHPGAERAYRELGYIK
jgi:hypothetical protein